MMATRQEDDSLAPMTNAPLPNSQSTAKGKAMESAGNKGLSQKSLRKPAARKKVALKTTTIVSAPQKPVRRKLGSSKANIAEVSVNTKPL